VFFFSSLRRGEPKRENNDQSVSNVDDSMEKEADETSTSSRKAAICGE
jgi:hypothetical protein